MRVHQTGHPIADSVASAFQMANYPGDADLVYGILRHNVFNQTGNWFEVDRGYFNPGHFDGYYRISYKGTQSKWHQNIPKQDIEFELEAWKNNKLGYYLCIPPSQYVVDFFGLPKINDWVFQTAYPLYDLYPNLHIRVKHKDENWPIDWENVKGVITFNSSIGWQALQRGIPVYSDPDHSIIGSYYKAKMQNPIDFLSDEYKQIDRKPLFEAMRAHQFTLKEISEGKAKWIIKHYLNQPDIGNGR